MFHVRVDRMEAVMAEPAFGARCSAALADRGPLCVGIDPHDESLRAWGLNTDISGVEYFCMTLVDALAGQVAVMKPQSAFFERFGSAGTAVLEKVVTRARSAGTLVLLDAKRGDIVSTMQAYAQAYLDPISPLAVDAVTATPFLGVGSLRPMFEAADAHGAGVFVLALTSNPEGNAVQRARRKDGRTVAQSIIDEVGNLNASRRPLGSLGVVVGATVGACRSQAVPVERQKTYGITHTTGSVGEAAHDLSRLAGPILVPGMGTQGGKPADLKRVLGEATDLAIPSYSREIARHGPSVDRLRAVARTLAEQCGEALRP